MKQTSHTQHTSLETQTVYQPVRLGECTRPPAQGPAATRLSGGQRPRPFKHSGGHPLPLQPRSKEKYT